MVIIAGRKLEDRLLTALCKNGGHVIRSMYGMGTVDEGLVTEAFGLMPEQNKIIIICIMAKKKSDAFLNILISDFHFDKPHTGIAYVIPVEKLSY
jgi:hypothetical protein